MAADAGVERGGVVSDCGAREGVIGEGSTEEASGLREGADGVETGEVDGPRDAGPGAGIGEPEVLH